MNDIPAQQYSNRDIQRHQQHQQQNHYQQQYKQPHQRHVINQHHNQNHNYQNNTMPTRQTPNYVNYQHNNNPQQQQNYQNTPRVPAQYPVVDLEQTRSANIYKSRLTMQDQYQGQILPNQQTAF